ncbi:hypothetical protein [Acidithiobacillus caldus]|jgi:chemotaxis protein CheZ|uniref:Chemotaxis protein CheZ n=3 Tax=Acidithiobacillus caldus TaxID=33059 RepID=F9ZN56_ACICS|nr:hypothetical protein [Acidithiobacillus caldus]AEK58099.1 conserved hypothetical protein [Acidithiobacillus caldus SM-1]AIA55089.1 hypothetical protein Acaty_c1221 [Acidithiobacillus caldus ATCC 51756]AUW32745.1 protein phosphatase CheZ [Acidithiobacillus caldus]MBU2730291.1 protein phosphatase CheZ [Acidithiobacillus caldus]MBU2734364.1 protein phosphatase CheZ [Acidithiobacillus caldus ATCC 51756]
MTSGSSGDLLGGTENLLREGLRRLGASAELSGAHQPLREALELTGKQTLATIAYVEHGQALLRDLRQGNIPADSAYDELEAVFRQIVASQQGQDLAGQRLQQALALLQMVEHRIRLLLADAGVAAPTDVNDTQADTVAMGQDDVDAILRDLGI